jgi:DHA3 family macrolide efflux protein-like MFS transporter
MGIFKNKLFARLFFASFASQLGTTIGNMAFAFYLLDHFSKQPYFATLAELMYALPTLFVFFIVGVIADRMDRKKIAENSDWIRAGLTVLLLAAVWFQSLFLIFLILFVRSAISKFFAPAEMSLLQGILDKEQYMQASGLNQAVMGMFMLFGMGLGALSYRYLGMEGTIMIDGASFIISAILIRSCAIPQDVRLPNGKTNVKDLQLRHVLSDFRKGIVYIVNYKLLLSIIFGFFVFGLVNGCFAVLPIFTMKYKLAAHNYELYTSLFSILIGIGFIIGSAISNVLIRKLQPYRVIILGIFLVGAGTAVMGFLENIWLYFAFVLGAGIVLAPVNVALSGWMNELVDPKFMGRVTAWTDPFMMLAHSISLGIIAIMFPNIVGVETLYSATGILLMGISVYYFIVLPQMVKARKRMKQKEEVTV